MKKILLLVYFITYLGFAQTNYSVVFDGMNDSLSVNHSNSFNFGTGDFAIEFWYKSVQLMESSVSVINKKNGSRYFEIIPSSGNEGLPVFVFGNGSSVYYAYGNAQIDNNEWNHLTAVKSGNYTKLFVNGINSDSTNLPSQAYTDNDADIVMGGVFESGEEVINFLDEVRLWNRALTSDEIEAIMNTELYGDEQGLVGYWNFNEGQGNLVNDLTSNSNDGQLYGANWSEDNPPLIQNILGVSISHVEASIYPGVAGDTIQVPVNVDLQDVDLFSVGVRLDGFQSHLEFLGIDTNETLVGNQGWSFVSNAQDDILLTGVYGSDSITTSGVLFKLGFYVPETLSVGSIPINITQIDINELSEEFILTNGSVLVSHSKLGDVTLNDTVTYYDGSMVLRYLVGLEEFDFSQMVAADVTIDGAVTALDASIIGQYAAELVDSLPYTDQALLAGNGEFHIQGNSFYPGQELSIPISIINGDNLLSFEMDIQFDPNSVQFVSLDWSQMIDHFAIEENITDGSIHYAGAGLSPDGQNGVFGNINLIVLDEFSADSFEINLDSYKINETVTGSEVIAVFMNSSILNTNSENMPDQFLLMQNYPNPFNPNTTIQYSLSKPEYMELIIYDYRGNHIKSLLNGYYNPGLGQVKWNSRNDSGEKVAAGIYFYKIETNNYVKSKKMILLK